MFQYTPWRSDCATFRAYNPASGNFWNGVTSSDGSRSGWCPGTATNPVYFPVKAIKCGFTPQYGGLEDLHRKYSEKGLVILGFPCNQFGNQEPGTPKEISEGCLVNYGVSFQLFEKIEVNGPGTHLLFVYLKKELPGFMGRWIKWNFEGDHCQIKKRIIMMNKPKSKKAWRWKAAAFLPLLALLLIAFGRPGGNTLAKNTGQQRNQLDTLINGKRLVIKDTTKYSSSFIKSLKSSFYLGNETLKVIDDSFITTYRPKNRPDTLVTYKYTIPTNLELNKETRFSTRDKDKSFTLILKRTNYTNIEYQLKQEGKSIKSGIAELQSTFYLGDEAQDDEKGKSIYLNQYLDMERCGAYIKVEIKEAKIATITYCVNEKAEKWEHLPVFKRE